jgi:hypothetical protein
VLSEILAETDSHRILHLIAHSASEVTQRHSPILRILLDNASADPAVAAAAGFAERRYKERLAIVADHLVALGAVATDPARTGQILWFYFGFTAWATVRELGWDWPEAATWLADQAASALLHSNPEHVNVNDPAGPRPEPSKPGEPPQVQICGVDTY